MTVARPRSNARKSENVPSKRPASGKSATRSKPAVSAKPAGSPKSAGPAGAAAKRYAAQVVRRLTRAYPDAVCSLAHRSPFELLVATILSAQCTDERVNLVSKDLFKKYHGPADYLRVPAEELKRDIQSTGFFNNKAKNIRACCEAILRDHGGEVPARMDALVELPGVGRKTANVVLGAAFQIAEGVVVDTHVARISRRLGLSAEKDPEKIEADLAAAVPKSEWIALSHRMIRHGRRCCKARKPQCDACPLGDICPRIGVESR